MKSIVKTLIAASLSIAAVSACSEEKLSPSTTGTRTTVHFGATSSIVDNTTKATLTSDDDNRFIGAWENGDEIKINYFGLDDDANEVTGDVNGTWNGSSFDASVESSVAQTRGSWEYKVAYPVPDASDNHVDFGSARTQKGNSYNSKYDIMIGSAEAENAAAGKDDKGNNIVFKMERQTAIAYFHFTSNLDETITSATLSVSGDNAFIASNYAYVSGFIWAAHGDCTSITVTFPEEAPNARDFQLWFNVLPTSYDSITLTVETATKTLTINNSTKGSYTAGHLYKAVKTIPDDKWVEKGGSITPTYVTDVITADLLKATSVKYEDFSGVKVKSSAEYAGNSSKNSNGDIQLRSKNSNSGIVTSKSGGNVRKVAVVWGNGNGNDKKIDVYGNTTAYASAANLYATGNANQGTLLGSIVYGTSTELTVTGDYAYVGICSNDGALYLASVSFVWDGESGGDQPGEDTYSISFGAVDGGKLSSNVTSASEGTEITLSAIPDAGYEFNNDWSVKDAAGSDITVTDGKFTMPAGNVTVTGSFTQLSYAITKADAVGGSFAVMNGETEVSSAHYNDVITLKATPDEGYEFTSWTVAYKDGATDKSFNPNGTFNMPAFDVTVSANFTEVAKIPVYASLADLIAAEAPTSAGTQVTVTLTDEVITKFYKSNSYTNGVYFNVGDQEIMIYCRNTPSDWKVGGAVSGTLTNCNWKIYSGTWELCPDDYTELTYVAPLEPCEAPSIVLDGATATITCATDGATIHYTVGDSPADPTAADAVYTSPVILTDGQTIKAIAIKDGMLNSPVSSKKYVEGGSSIETYQHVFTSKPSIGNNTLSGVEWKVSATALNNYNSANYAGVQFGSSKANGQITLETTSEWLYKSKKTVKEVRLWLNMGGTSVTPTVKIGNKAAISDGKTVVKNSSAKDDWTKTTKVTFTPVEGGDTGIIIIDVQSVKAGYICAIEIDVE